jgi:hypothetical protein
VSSLRHSGTYGLGSLRPDHKPGLPTVGRCRYTKEERRARLAVLREAFILRGRSWWKTPRSILHMIQFYPDAYQSEIKEVLKAMTKDDSPILLVCFMHGNRSFYKVKP